MDTKPDITVQSTNVDKTSIDSIDSTTIQKSSFDITNVHNTSFVSTNVHKSISNLFQNICLSSLQELLQCLFKGFLKEEIIKIKNEERIKAVFVYMRNILLKLFYLKNILNLMKKYT